MEHLTTKLKSFLVLLLLSSAMALQSCYKDNEEDLYPEPDECNTDNVSFSQTIMPVITNNCVSCHSGSAPSGGVGLSDYAEVVASIDGGRFLGAIRHESGFSAMPQGAAKLSDCTISQIEAWVEQGKKNN
jgi:cytochrome c553